MNFRNLIILAFTLATSPLSAASIHLDFDGLIAGVIEDTNGIGTGFTHRLPGTGEALPANDPRLNLLANPGRLTYTSTFSDINQNSAGSPFNNQLSAPGFLLLDTPGKDITLTALFLDVAVPGPSDQLEFYVGSSINSSIRAGFHNGNILIFTENQGAGDQNTNTPNNAFTPGDDLILRLARSGGLWNLAWVNLSNLPASGTFAPRSIPWLDQQSDLYVGILASNAGSETTFVSQLDYFEVTIVPEPSSAVICSAGIVGLVLVIRRRQCMKQGINAAS